jgi:hypothetical protein
VIQASPINGNVNDSGTSTSDAGDLQVNLELTRGIDEYVPPHQIVSLRWLEQM